MSYFTKLWRSMVNPCPGCDIRCNRLLEAEEEKRSLLRAARALEDALQESQAAYRETTAELARERLLLVEAQRKINQECSLAAGKDVLGDAATWQDAQRDHYVGRG